MSVALTAIRKSYPAPDEPRTSHLILDLPALRLETGEQVALTGPSGSGKSTLLHIIAGTLTPDAGTVVHDWDGPPFAMTSSGPTLCDRYRGRHIGCVFQGSHLLAGLNARDNVLLALTVTGRAPDRRWADELLGALGLAQRRQHLPHQLSPGQRVRVACARALVGRPQLLLVDEPTAALDRESAGLVLDLLLPLAAQLRACVLVITHDVAVVARLGRELPIASLQRGRAC